LDGFWPSDDPFQLTLHITESRLSAVNPPNHHSHALVRHTHAFRLTNTRRGCAFLAAAVLLLSSVSSRADLQDDMYLKVLNLVQQADGFEANNQPKEALKKYQEAQTALQTLYKKYPNWNGRMVSYRASYLEEKVNSLSSKVAQAAGAGAASGTNGAAAGESKPVAETKTEIKLVSPGGEPRKALRVHPKAGDKQTCVLTLKTTTASKMGEAQVPATKLPAITITLEVNIKEVSAEGDINYDVSVTDATVAEDASAAPQMAAVLKAQIGTMKGASASGTISSRGLNKSEIKPSGGEARQGLDEIKEFVSVLLAPFPEEPVGPGAKWEARGSKLSQGATVQETKTYELVSGEGDHGTTRASISQTASNQKIRSPAMPGVDMNLIRMTNGGNMELTLDLGQFLPTEGVVDTHTEQTVSLGTGAKAQTITTITDLNVHVEAK
jgi:hypothetical protein